MLTGSRRQKTELRHKAYGEQILEAVSVKPKTYTDHHKQSVQKGLIYFK